MSCRVFYPTISGKTSLNPDGDWRFEIGAEG